VLACLFLVKHRCVRVVLHARPQNQAIIYLDFQVGRCRNKDPAIHNYLLSLFAKQEDDTDLLSFISRQTLGVSRSGLLVSGRRHSFSFDTLLLLVVVLLFCFFLSWLLLLTRQRKRPVFDLKYALRVCTLEGKDTACVHIYSAMGLYEEAVELALAKVGVDLAKQNAQMPEDDEELLKKLWLRVAHHVIEKERNVKQCVAGGDAMQNARCLSTVVSVQGHPSCEGVRGAPDRGRVEVLPGLCGD